MKRKKVRIEQRTWHRDRQRTVHSIRTPTVREGPFLRHFMDHVRRAGTSAPFGSDPQGQLGRFLIPMRDRDGSDRTTRLGSSYATTLPTDQAPNRQGEAKHALVNCCESCGSVGRTAFQLRRETAWNPLAVAPALTAARAERSFAEVESEIWCAGRREKCSSPALHRGDFWS